MSSVVSFKGVTKTYEYSHLGKTTLSRGVDGLDLEIAAGEAFGLLGLNGSGKTTTFKLVMGLLRPTRGTVSVLGRTPAEAGAAAQIGYLPELPYFYPFLTAVEALRFYGRLSGLEGAALEARLDTVVVAVGLEKLRDQRMGRLSKGNVQRVGLAQALLHDPALLVLDEPVSGLDPLAIKRFRDALEELKGRGKTLFISSHSISELEKLCDRVGVLKDGRLVASLAQKDWLAHPGGLEGLFIEEVSK